MSAKAETKLPTNRGTYFLAFLLLLAIGAFVYTAYVVIRDAGYDADYLEIAGDLRILQQQISTSSREATDGDGDAFDNLEKSRSRFDRSLKVA